MKELFRPFDFEEVVLMPWTDGFAAYGWVMLMAFLVSAALGLVGNYIILRRMALIGDAISHSLLPGIAIAFILTGSRATLPMLIGAIIAGILTVLMIEVIHKQSRVKPDAAIGIVFSTFFAVGVVLISLFAGHIDLDMDCVLYGEIGSIPFETPLELFGRELGPFKLWRMGMVLFALIVFIVLFYKELLVTSFDPGLANSLGIRSSRYHYGLMVVLSITIVTAFEAVGAILVIAMLIFPGSTASLLTDRFHTRLLLSVLFSAAYAVTGLHLAVWLNSSVAAAVTVAAGAFFVVVWVVAPRKGLHRYVTRRFKWQRNANKNSTLPADAA